MLYLFLVTIALVLIINLITAIRRPKNFPPGPFWLPIVGNTHQLKKLSLALGGQHLAFSKLSQEYKSNVIGLKLGGKYVVVVSSYPLVKMVLTSEEYDGRPDNFFMKLRSLGTGKDRRVLLRVRVLEAKIHHYQQTIFLGGYEADVEKDLPFQTTVRHILSPYFLKFNEFLSDYDRKLTEETLVAGITGTDGEHWRIQKYFVTVHLRHLGFGTKTMEKQIQEEAAEILDILEENENEELQMGEILPISVLNVLWMLISGLRLNRNDDRLVKLLKFLTLRAKAFDMAGGTLNQLPWLRFIAPERTGYNLIRKLNEELKALFMEPIKEHFKTWTEGRDDDLIYAFITEMRKANGEKTTFTEEQLVMVCLDIFLAGAQTTSNTLDFAFLMMLLYPDVKNKVHACLDGAFRKTEEITYSDRKRVPYVEAVLYEVERFHTIAPIIGPRRVLKETTLDGYTIPKDSTVLMNLYSVHHDEQYWKDPEIFRPERFLDEEGKLLFQERLLPFGLGKRRCFGEVLARSCLFTFFSEVMRGYQIELPPNAAKPTGIALPGITISPEKYSSVFIKR